MEAKYGHLPIITSLHDGLPDLEGRFNELTGLKPEIPVTYKSHLWRMKYFEDLHSKRTHFIKAKIHIGISIKGLYMLNGLCAVVQRIQRP